MGGGVSNLTSFLCYRCTIVQSGVCVQKSRPSRRAFQSIPSLFLQYRTGEHVKCYLRMVLKGYIIKLIKDIETQGVVDFFLQLILA